MQISDPKASGLSVNQVVAVFAALLHRYTGSTDVAFDVAVTGEESAREHPSNRIHADFSDDPSFAAVVAGLEPSASRIAQSGDGFRCLVPEDLSRYLRARDRTFLNIESELAIVYKAPGGLELEYSRGIFGEGLASRLGEHCRRLLESALRTPDLPVSELEMMDESELRAIMAGGASDAGDFERETIPELFEQQVLRVPDAPALRYDDQIFTYRELNARALQAATALQALSVAPEVLVGVLLDEPLAVAVTYLGIVMAGGVVVALDPEWPAERLRQVIEETAPDFIVTSAALATAIPFTAARVILQPTINVPDSGKTFSKPALTPDNAAYVVFTSGSTGKPKGVVGLHRTITAVARLSLPLRTDEVLALSSNLAFGAGLIGLFFPLMQGAAVLLVPSTLAKDLSALARTWEAARVTRVVLVAPQLRQLVLPGMGLAARLRNITTVALAGAVLTADMLPAVYELFPQALIINAYSCIEVGTMVSRWQTTPDNRSRDLNIGRTLPNIRVYILGQRLEPLPLGMPGEICVASADLSRGYLNRPDLTRERFVPNPFGAPGMARLYRTGDIGRFLPNGELEYLGRLDNQVKVRGIRIELEEIEIALQRKPEVFQSVVLAVPQGAESRLVAFVSAKEGANISAASLREHLQGLLPSYMVPPLFVVMDRLPMTRNGKIDRQRLPLTVNSRPEVDTPYVAPRDSLEASITSIWEKELGIDAIGVADHFLEIGGDSLIAARIVIQVQEQFDCELAVVSVFEHPTVEDFAVELRSKQSQRPDGGFRALPASA